MRSRVGSQLRSRDQPDVAVPEVEQVADRGAHARTVICEHSAHTVELRDLPVEQHARPLDLAERVQRRRLGLAREREDQPVHAALREHPDVLGVELGIALRVREQHGVPLLAQPALGALDDLGEQRVRDVADDEPDRVRGPAAQPLGEQVRPVAELAHGREHALAHRG